MQTWRSLLDPDGILYVQKSDVQRACAQVGWRGDVSVLWSALDASNGRAALEEFGFKDTEIKKKNAPNKHIFGLGQVCCKWDMYMYQYVSLYIYIYVYPYMYIYICLPPQNGIYFFPCCSHL